MHLHTASKVPCVQCRSLVYAISIFSAGAIMEGPSILLSGSLRNSFLFLSLSLYMYTPIYKFHHTPHPPAAPHHSHILITNLFGMTPCCREFPPPKLRAVNLYRRGRTYTSRYMLHRRRCSRTGRSVLRSESFSEGALIDVMRRETGVYVCCWRHLGRFGV